MPVGKRADDLEGLGQGQLGRPVCSLHLPQGIGLCRWPVAEVGEGAVARSASFVEGLADQYGGRGVAVGSDGDIYAHFTITLPAHVKRNIYITSVLSH